MAAWSVTASRSRRARGRLQVRLKVAGTACTKAYVLCWLLTFVCQMNSVGVFLQFLSVLKLLQVFFTIFNTILIQGRLVTNPLSALSQVWNLQTLWELIQENATRKDVGDASNPATPKSKRFGRSASRGKLDRQGSMARAPRPQYRAFFALSLYRVRSFNA